VSYIGRRGNPGAFQYLYEASPGGNVVAGTNAPVDHSDNVPSLGEPVVHPSELSPETNSEFFDEQGRKLDRPVPSEAETNENYDPDKFKGNFWVKRFPDKETGEMNYAYLHRDQILDPKMDINLSIRYVDAQLPKIRHWYQSLLASEDFQERALGLFVALMDQGRMSLHDLEDLVVANIKISSGNVVTILTHNGHKVRVVLDIVAHKVLQELLDGKSKEESVFSKDGHRIDVVTINKFLHDKFGVDAHALRLYGVALAFVREFQRLVNMHKGKLGIEFVGALQEQAAQSVASDFGVSNDEIVHLIDPIVSQALMMAAIVSGDSVGKSDGHKLQGHLVFQGLPIAIENKAGSYRHWYDQSANESGKTKMLYPYGYIKRTTGTDGDQVDVYIGPDKESDKVFIVHQMKKPDFNVYDEDKVMLGFSTAKKAKEAYLKHFDDPRFFGFMTTMSMKEFKGKVFKTKDNPGMVKSMVFTVESGKVDRTPEEESFSQWLHKYPLHEHELHWNALIQHASKGEEEKNRKIVEKPHVSQGLSFNAVDFPIAEAV
jgi:hypothetical protein